MFMLVVANINILKKPGFARLSLYYFIKMNKQNAIKYVSYAKNSVYSSRHKKKA